jgi:hypothetical protein
MEKIHLQIMFSGVVAVIETVTPQMLENTCWETEYRLDILRAMKGAHVEVV